MSEVEVRPHRIALKLSPGSRHEEAIAHAAITPGMYCEMVPGEAKEKVRPHSVAGDRGEFLFAEEDALQGKVITDAYSHLTGEDSENLGDIVFLIVAMPGDHIYARLQTSEVATRFAALASNGNGNLKVADTGDQIVAYALEALTATGAPAHIRVRVATPGDVVGS